jgi:hypothetical protein
MEVLERFISASRSKFRVWNIFIFFCLNRMGYHYLSRSFLVSVCLVQFSESYPALVPFAAWL